MENASKALIIAGAILVSISIIVLGVALINGTGGFQDQAQSSADSLAIQTFNREFLDYEGEVTAREARELVSKVRASNESNKDHTITLEGKTSDFKTGTKYKVTLKYNEADDKEEGGYIKRIHIGT